MKMYPANFYNLIRYQYWYRSWNPNILYHRNVGILFCITCK